MSQPPPVDEAALAAATGRWLGSTVRVENLRRLSGGASRETWSYDAVDDTSARQALVLRRDPGAASQAARATEFEVLRAAGAAGVLVPEVAFLLDDGDGLGTGFVMRRVEGETIPRRILRDDEYRDVRGVLARQLGEQAARVHAVPTDSLPEELPVLGGREQLDQYRSILDGIGEPHPAFELALRRLERDVPDPVTPTLVHGDFRNGNLVVGPEGLRALLDWELTHLGDPAEDLAWCCVRSWRFGNVDQRVGGFGDVETLLDAYEGAGGTPIDRARLDWWEAFGTLKWGLICAIQAHTHLSGLVRSVELATLGRRIAETEWDVLALLVPDAMAQPAPPEPGGDATPHSLQDRPSAAELLEAVREFVERDVQPTLDGREAFHARVAANALGIVERELVLGPVVEAPALERISAVLGRTGTPRELVTAFATAIREGSVDDRADDVVDAVVALVAAKLTIANPKYATT